MTDVALTDTGESNDQEEVSQALSQTKPEDQLSFEELMEESDKQVAQLMSSLRQQSILIRKRDTIIVQLREGDQHLREQLSSAGALQISGGLWPVASCR